MHEEVLLVHSLLVDFKKLADVLDIGACVGLALVDGLQHLRHEFTRSVLELEPVELVERKSAASRGVELALVFHFLGALLLDLDHLLLLRHYLLNLTINGLLPVFSQV